MSMTEKEYQEITASIEDVRDSILVELADLRRDLEVRIDNLEEKVDGIGE